jgi:putative transposase
MKIAGRFSKEFFLGYNGFSRQFVYKKRQSKQAEQIVRTTLVSKVLELRKKHRTMGSRVMYYQLNITEVGVNKFEKIVSDNGLSVIIKRKKVITTNGVYDQSDENLINGKVLTNINQVIAGDITYLILKEKVYYIFTLKDMYSRRIVGLYGSENMLAESAVKTLKQVIKLRGKELKSCIHHSDAGSQYKSNRYKKILTNNGIIMSIAQNCLQNGMAEQLNGVLKNSYLTKDIKNIKDLNNKLNEIKKLINEERPVKELGYKTPLEFEQWIENQEYKPKKELYDFRKIR